MNGFRQIITHELKPIEKSSIKTDVESDRFFEGLLTAEVVDKHNELTVRDELLNALPTWLKRGGSISNGHTNQIVGKGLSFEPAIVIKDGNEIPAIKIQAYIYKDNKVDDMVWGFIQKGIYKGLSYGGVTRSAKGIQYNSDGSITAIIKDIDIMEVAVCPNPACPLALIFNYNQIAKSIPLENVKFEPRDDEEIIMKCERNLCVVGKSDGDRYITDEKSNGGMTEMSDDLKKEISQVVKDTLAATAKENELYARIEALEKMGHGKKDKMDEEEEEVEKGEPAKKLNIDNNTKIKLPEAEANDDDSKPSEKPDDDSRSDDVSIEEKEEFMVGYLLDKYPQMFSDRVLKEMNMDEEEEKESENVTKSETPQISQAISGNEGVSISDMVNKGGDPTILNKLNRAFRDFRPSPAEGIRV